MSKKILLLAAAFALVAAGRSMTTTARPFHPSPLRAGRPRPRRGGRTANVPSGLAGCGKVRRLSASPHRGCTPSRGGSPSTSTAASDATGADYRSMARRTSQRFRSRSTNMGSVASATRLDKMPTDLRAIIEATHYQGLTHDETARKLRLPIGTVKSRSHRAHRRLAALLAHLEEATAEV